MKQERDLTFSSSFLLSKASRPAFNVALLSGVGSMVNTESSTINKIYYDIDLLQQRLGLASVRGNFKRPIGNLPGENYF